MRVTLAEVWISLIPRDLHTLMSDIEVRQQNDCQAVDLQRSYHGVMLHDSEFSKL